MHWLDHWNSQIEEDVCEEHRRDNKGEPCQNFVAIALSEPACICLSDGQVEHKEHIAGIACLVGHIQRVKTWRKGHNEAEKDNEEEAHRVHHIEDHSNQMANFTENSEEVEHFEPQEKRGKSVDGPLILKQLVLVFVLNVPNNWDKDGDDVCWEGYEIDWWPQHGLI